MLVRGCLFGVNNQKVNSCQAKKIWTTRESFCSEQRNFRQKIPWAQEILALPCFGQRGRLDTVWADSDARQAWNPQSGRCWCSSSVTNIQVLEVFQAGGSLGHILCPLDESENFFLTISGLRQESRLRQLSLECLRMQFCCWFWMDEIGRKCL